MNDTAYMELAIQLAKNTLGQTSPNPVVGAVVVKDGMIVGMGAHLKAGEEHAEVNALNMAGEKAEGATIYVTLEPCSHYGRTPPCCDLIIEKKLKRVVIASDDPNPLVAGRGIKRLKDAGIRVRTGILKKQADELNEVFFHFITQKRPFVTLKSATSLDGKIATSTGESKWITGGAAREDVHLLRHQHDAILVGVGTVLADDPSLTTRIETGGKNPIRIILDHGLNTPLTAKVVKDNVAQTIIVTSQHACTQKENKLVQSGVKVIRLSENTIRIKPLLEALAQNNICSVLVEGGSKVNDSFLRSRFVNKVVTYIAPKLIGGEKAPTSFGGEGFKQLQDGLLLTIASVEKLGEDIKIVAIPKGGES